MATLRSLSQDGLSITSPSGRGLNALGVALLESKVLQWLEGVSGWELGGTLSSFTPVESNVQGTTRAIGGNFTRQTIAPATPHAITLAIYGDVVNWDRTFTDDVRRNLQNTTEWYNQEIVVRIRNVVRTLESAMFNGNGTLPNMAGLKTIASALPGFSGAVGNRVMDAAPSGEPSLDTTTATGLLGLAEVLDEAVGMVPNANGILLPSRLLSKINTLGRSYSGVGEARNMLGVSFTTWNTVPLVPVLDESIMYNEPDNDSATTTTSLYVVRAGESLLSFVSNCGLYYKDGDVPGQEKTEESFEFRLNTKCREPRSILRVRNIKV